jgi:type IV secretion system protein VirB3
MQTDYFDPIYKGCTQPSMAFGVPMVPFVLVTMVFAQIAFLSLVAVGAAPCVMALITYGLIIAWARRVSRNDDQRLLQLMMRTRMRGRHNGGSRAVWGAISFGPHRPASKK